MLLRFRDTFRQYSVVVVMQCTFETESTNTKYKENWFINTYTIQNRKKTSLSVEISHLIIQRHDQLRLFQTKHVTKGETECKRCGSFSPPSASSSPSIILAPRPPAWWCCFPWWPVGNETRVMLNIIYMLKCFWVKGRHFKLVVLLLYHIFNCVSI